jgi:hypothetical protein
MCLDYPWSYASDPRRSFSNMLSNAVNVKMICRNDQQNELKLLEVVKQELSVEAQRYIDDAVAKLEEIRREREPRETRDKPGLYSSYALNGHRVTRARSR